MPPSSSYKPPGQAGPEKATGLILWRYLGGPWEEVESYALAGELAAPVTRNVHLANRGLRIMATRSQARTGMTLEEFLRLAEDRREALPGIRRRPDRGQGVTQSESTAVIEFGI